MSLFDTLLDPLGKVRDEAARAFLNHVYVSLNAKGEPVTRLEIDKGKRTIAMELSLTGEPVPINLNVGAYRIVTQGADNFLEVSKVKASRPWIEAAIQLAARDGWLRIGKPLPSAALLAL